MRYTYRILEREGGTEFTDEPAADRYAPNPSSLRASHDTIEEAAQVIVENAKFPTYCFIVTEVRRD